MVVIKMQAEARPREVLGECNHLTMTLETAAV